MKRKKLRSLSAVLLIGWCLIFLRCETTEKSMVRALYLAQKEQSITVGLLYQAPEAAADASEASGAVQLQLAQADTLAKALAAAQKQLPQKADYRLCDYLLIDQDASEELLAAYERTVLENRQGRVSAKVSVLEMDDGFLEELPAEKQEFPNKLLEAIAGLQDPEEGSSIMFIPPDKEASELVGRDPEDIYKSGVGLAFVPEDRFGMGLVGSMDLVDNIMLRSYKSGKSPIADRKHPRERANKIVEELEVVTPNLGTPLRRLSGGNVQKILVGREIAAEPSLLMTAYAVRGLDINTSYTIYHLLNEQKAKGAAVIYVGEDLDVLLELCDRIVVLCAGQVSGIVNGRSARKEEVGLLMTRLSGKENANE